VSSANPNKEWCVELYERKAAQLILYGRALGLSHGEAEDVLQETFVRLLHEEIIPRQIEHYCVRAYRNQTLNYKRSLWRRIARELESARWFETGGEETPAEKAAMKALAKLPPEQREVIVLKIWHQYTFEEIGELMKISPNTASGRYRYGLQKIRTALKALNYEQPEFFGESFASLETPRAFA
jgi:RNA polymerase sigma-70 factor (ECF subfamily)